MLPCFTQILIQYNIILMLYSLANITKHVTQPNKFSTHQTGTLISTRGKYITKYIQHIQYIISIYPYINVHICYRLYVCSHQYILLAQEIIQCVPFATEPGISLIILPLMRILLADRCSVSQHLGALQTHSSSFPTQRTYCCSNFFAISSCLVL